MLDLSEHIVPRFQANNDQYRNNGMPSHVSSKLPELERRVQSKQMSVLPARILCRVQTKTTAKLWRCIARPGRRISRLGRSIIRVTRQLGNNSHWVRECSRVCDHCVRVGGHSEIIGLGH